jgi:hypothetical protein
MSEVKLVRSLGGARTQVRPSTVGLPAKRPQATKLAREQLLRKLNLPTSGSVFATLGPSAPGVANRAALVFVNPSGVDCGWGCAWWRGGELPEPDEDKRVVIWFKAESAFKRYLVDAVVNPGLPQTWNKPVSKKTCPFEVHGPNLAQTFQIASGGGHVAFVADTPTAGWYGYSLSAPEPWRFTFWYCELTRL